MIKNAVSRAQICRRLIDCLMKLRIGCPKEYFVNKGMTFSGRHLLRLLCELIEASFWRFMDSETALTKEKPSELIVRSTTRHTYPNTLRVLSGINSHCHTCDNWFATRSQTSFLPEQCKIGYIRGKMERVG